MILHPTIYETSIPDISKLTWDNSAKEHLCYAELSCTILNMMLCGTQSMKSIEVKEDRKRCLSVILSILAPSLCTLIHRIPKQTRIFKNALKRTGKYVKSKKTQRVSLTIAVPDCERKTSAFRSFCAFTCVFSKKLHVNA